MLSTLIYKILGCLLVAASWIMSYEIATTIMKYTYDHSLIMLRTRNWSYQTSVIRRILVSTVFYAMIFNLISWAVVAQSYLMSDPENIWGLASYLVSWDYLINPWYFLILILMTFVTSIFVVFKFRNVVNKDKVIKVKTYDTVMGAGRLVWLVSGSVIMTFVVMNMVRNEMADNNVISRVPSGDQVAESIAYGIAALSVRDEGLRDKYKEMLLSLDPSDAKKVKDLVSLARQKNVRVRVGTTPSTNSVSKSLSYFKRDDTKRVSHLMKEMGYDENTRIATRNNLNDLLTIKNDKVLQFLKQLKQKDSDAVEITS
ncbi:hypothetical protein TetV_347 [Tetraselmis virus 1]|uniref:Uncharacterized protein n=1 Tax=Tetraselmis virus 1 TaxID=2060617 RepID=A0A2P0VNW0_9VIRU|nr:hypothetical protein QJ968_gp347 [Tetraselmis virus 1]AUF82439.1 hypothetical protein TetV_347 [Tetraselmis virus 1]